MHDPEFILFAPNVHTGGGLLLLSQLLEAGVPQAPALAFLDERARERVMVPAGWRVIWCAPSLNGRLGAELKLREVSRATSTILCFHNLPPLLPVRGRVLCFVQNRIVLLPREFGLKGWVALRSRIEHRLATVLRSRIELYIVQTPSMAALIHRWAGGSPVKVSVLPFANRDPMGEVSPQPRVFDFIYVSDGLPHKNHRALFAAWVLLAEEGIQPTLAITLGTADQEALQALEAVQHTEGLSVTNLGRLDREGVDAAYSQSGALIFPSLTESFGLPLIEARERGLPILAGELDYVRDVCVPVETFDPRSPRSIARAVKRHLGYGSDPLEPMPASRFWAALDALLKS